MTAKYWLYIVLHALLVAVGSFMATYDQPVLNGIGSSLIAAGISGWIVFLYVFFSASTADRLALMESLGLRRAFLHRSVVIRKEYEARLAKATEKIDIMGFGLRALREDLSKDFPNWASRAQVRILLLDPEFPTQTHSLAQIRDKEEGNPDGSISSDVIHFVQEASKLMSGNPNFQVRLYRAIPTINYFRIDDEAFWGPYFISTPSRNTPTFIISRTGSLFGIFADHFDALWNNGQFSREAEEILRTASL